MNLFINHFAFTEPRENLQESDIIEMLENLSQLFIALKKINVELIIHQTLSQSIFLEKPIREYISKLNQKHRMSARILIDKQIPICSDIDTAFESDESISFGNCKEEVENLDVLYTFLSCAMYYRNPILTINNLCAKEQFLEDTINIVCDESEYKLDNYQLIPYLEVIEKLKKYQKENLLNEYGLIDNWNDYKKFVNEYFQYVKITNHCMNELETRYSYSNSYSDIFRKKVLRFNTLILENGGKPKEINFSPLGLGTQESKADVIALKKSHKGIKNFEGNEVYLNWHEYIQRDCRVYFEKEDDHVCFVHYEKKIDR